MNYIIKRQILCGSIGVGVLSNFREPGIIIIMKLQTLINEVIREHANEAYYNKNIYDGKKEYAAAAMAKNKETQSLTDDQHDALSDLCSVRHELHTNTDSLIKSDEGGIKEKLISANIQLNQSGVPPMNFIPLDTSDYIDIDTIDLLYELEEVPENEEERQIWYDDNYYRIHGELSNLNSKIEQYLSEIDKKYGTQYCPTGLSRKF